MVSLDLSMAFDCLSYQEMHLAMQEVSMPEPLIRAIMHLHANTVLTIEHKGQVRTVTMKRGLRQGCGIAPLIYAAWTIRLCRLIDNKLGARWTNAHLSMFADDKHGFWKLGSPQDLHVALSQIGAVIDIIQDSEMIVNFSKSSAVIGISGKLQQKIMQTKMRQWGGQQCAKFHGSGGFGRKKNYNFVGCWSWLFFFRLGLGTRDNFKHALRL